MMSFKKIEHKKFIKDLNLFKDACDLTFETNFYGTGHKMKQQILKSFSIAGLLALTTFGAVAEDFERKFEVSPGGKLELKTDSGAVEVVTHNKDYVLVEVTTEGSDEDDFKLSTELNGNTVEVIGEVARKGFGWNRSLRVRFEITVPNEFDVEIDTAGGSIEVDDLIGELDARTSGGSIQIGSIKGSVKLHTSGGSIKTDTVFGPLNAHTSGGSIRATFAEQLTEDATLETSGGSITAYLLEDIKIDLDASTSGGRVKTDFDVDGRVKKRSIRGEINGGGPELTLHTSGGSVSVRSL